MFTTTQPLSKHKKHTAMKNRLTLLKLSLTCLLAVIGYTASAQLISPTDQSQLSVSGTGTDKKNAVFCRHGANFTLTASADDGATPTPVVFTKYQWSEKAGDGSYTVLTPTGRELKSTDLTAIAPGYHTYKAVGIVDANGVTCQATTGDEFTIFVLPNIQATAVVDPGVTSTTYCTDAVPTGTNQIKLTATVAFDPATTFNTVQGLATPTVDKFEFSYNWYKIADGATFDPANPGTPVATQTDGKSNTLAVTDATVGKFNYVAVATYTVQTGCDKSAATVTATNGGNAVITVLPKPGKPTITISRQ